MKPYGAQQTKTVVSYRAPLSLIPAAYEIVKARAKPIQEAATASVLTARHGYRSMLSALSFIAIAVEKV